MNETPNIKLDKPLITEKYDISVFNKNFDKIDTAIQELQDKTKPASTVNTGIVQLTDSISSSSTVTAATPNAVKQINDLKVNKIEGKDLSTNDLTDALKANYDEAFLHSISSHARIDATKTEPSQSNGYLKVNNAEIKVYEHPESHPAAMIVTDAEHLFVTESDKSIYADKYTKTEIDNKFSSLETDIDWKESVATYDDIAITYPTPADGWTVNVNDTDYTYRYNGTDWVAISANAIPKATQAIDGLLSKEDKTNYDDANSKKHIHNNQSIIDKISQKLLDCWNTAYEHINDTVKHITNEERELWNTIGNKIEAETTRAKNAENDLDLSKASVDSPAFTGLPTAPTAPVSTNTTQIATTAFVQTAINNGITISNNYTDTKIAELTNNTPDTPDTNVIESLEEAIGTKANQTDLDTHTSNNVIHITSDERQKWNDGIADIETLNNLLTETKKSVADGKSAIASALTTQGVSTAADATYATMAGNVGTVATNKYNAGVAATKKGTAVAAQVLKGKTFTNASGVNLTGTMVNYSGSVQTVTPSASQTGTAVFDIPDGYHTQIKVNSANVYNAGVAAGGYKTCTPSDWWNWNYDEDLGSNVWVHQGGGWSWSNRYRFKVVTGMKKPIFVTQGHNGGSDYGKISSYDSANGYAIVDIANGKTCNTLTGFFVYN